MSYASKKGADGEREAASYFSDVFQLFKYIFVRVGGAEKAKRMLFGDVILDNRSDPKRQCFISPYFLEVKKRKAIDAFKVLEEAEQHAEETGKRGSILYLIRQSEGSKRDGVLVAMSPKTFRAIAGELQGYINESINE